MKLVVEIECVGMNADEFDKETVSSDGLQLEQADLNCVHALNDPHLMIIESVKNGPLLWPSIEENGMRRPKKYSDLSATEGIQADCDVKATNIILQGLPHEVYALVRNHKVAKELWEIIQLLMQGTSVTKHERDCKLYDEFDKFAYKKGESLRGRLSAPERITLSARVVIAKFVC
nr:integrase, catalytic region, zinc finger, CCHC-type, peptidase aspartic, catalytic [Tanacetum cinerariifolium]